MKIRYQAKQTIKEGKANFSAIAADEELVCTSCIIRGLFGPEGVKMSTLGFCLYSRRSLAPWSTLVLEPKDSSEEDYHSAPVHKMQITTFRKVKFLVAGSLKYNVNILAIHNRKLHPLVVRLKVTDRSIFDLVCVKDTVLVTTTGKEIVRFNLLTK